MYKLIHKTNHFMIKRKPEVLISSNGLSPKNYSAATMKIKAKVTKVKTMTQLKTHQMIKRMMLGLIDNISTIIYPISFCTAQCFTFIL